MLAGHLQGRERQAGAHPEDVQCGLGRQVGETLAQQAKRGGLRDRGKETSTRVPPALAMMLSSTARVGAGGAGREPHDEEDRRTRRGPRQVVQQAQ